MRCRCNCLTCAAQDGEVVIVMYYICYSQRFEVDLVFALEKSYQKTEPLSERMFRLFCEKSLRSKKLVKIEQLKYEENLHKVKDTPMKNIQSKIYFD